MHEHHLMKNLFHKIDEIARNAGAERVTTVRVRLGALSHIDEAHFREHWVEGMKGSAAEGAVLEVDVSTDASDPGAQDILLESVDVL